jgi:hypothetical protein
MPEPAFDALFEQPNSPTLPGAQSMLFVLQSEKLLPDPSILV